MPLTQPVYDRLRLVFSIRTGVSFAAACYGYFLGVHAPRQLANALSVGLAVGAVALAVAFALSATTKRSRAPEEMLYRDREMTRLGVYTLRGAVATTLLTLSYVGLGGAFSHGEHLVALLGAVSALSLAWTFCSMPRVFLRRVTIIAGGDDEHPDLGGFWKPLRRLRKEASEDLQRSPSGWFVAGRPYAVPIDSPTFIAKELALRYGVLRSEAHMHYVQLCDMAGQSEASERIDRIVFCLEEMDRLRDLERQMRALLPQDPKLLRMLLL